MFIIGPHSLSRAIPGYRLVLVCWLGKSNTTFGGSITYFDTGEKSSFTLLLDDTESSSQNGFWVSGAKSCMEIGDYICQICTEACSVKLHV